MKLVKKPSPLILDVSELAVDGVYFDAGEQLVQIKEIDHEKKELHLFNITEQYNFYAVKFERHGLVRRVR